MAWTSPKTWSSAVLSSTEMNTHLRDNLLHLASTTGNLTLSTTGPHVIGGAPDPRYLLRVTGNFSPGGSAGVAGQMIDPTLTAPPNQDAFGLYVAPTILEAGSGTHDLFASVLISPPTITGAGAALTYASTLHLVGAPSGALSTSVLYIDAFGDTGIQVAFADTVNVAHGISSLVPNIVYGAIRKAHATEGGLSLEGYTEGTTPLHLSGVAITADTTQATTSIGCLQFTGAGRSGTTSGVIAAADNLVVFRNHVNATHIFKGNGNSYEDGTGWTAYDDTDDAALIETLEYELTAAQGRPIQRQFSAWLEDHRALLERQHLATFGADGAIFVNRSGIQALLCGFARQATARIVALEQRLARLEPA